MWSPGAAALTCPYCGVKKEIPQAPGQVLERPIEDALKAASDLGWGMARKAVTCRWLRRDDDVRSRARGVALRVLRGALRRRGAPERHDGASRRRPPVPRGPRRRHGEVPRVALVALVPSRRPLAEVRSVSELKGVYVPFWTFDAATHSAWTADAGYDYQVAVQVVENGQTHTRYETRTRWEPAEGVLEHFFDDLPVAASRGLPSDLARAIEPFPTADLLAYDASYLSGFLAEEYAVGPKEALASAQRRMTEELYAACGREVPGDRFRDLQVRTAWSGLACKNGLLPVWIAAYQYGGKPYPLPRERRHGQDGRPRAVLVGEDRPRGRRGRPALHPHRLDRGLKPRSDNLLPWVR